MKKFESIDAALDFAINEEEAARDFYLAWADKLKSPSAKAYFKEMSAEEQKHKDKLLDFKGGEKNLLSAEKVMDLKISDYQVDAKIDEDTRLQEALQVAMQKEKAAFRLYSALAEASDSPKVKELFDMLAQEEAKHKLKIEIEIDEYINTEN